MKWITATDLNQWADRRDAQSLLPELISRLIHAIISQASILRFPSGDAVHLPEWDGILESEEQVYTISPGLSLWECGTTKNVKGKADEDYMKRSKYPLGYNPQSVTYIFVTPRTWNGAKKWTQAKNAERIWKKVVVLTAIEIEDWLSRCPAVALWLAERLHRHPIQASTVDSFWAQWATGTKITLRPDLLLGGRNNEQEQLYQNLRELSVSVVQSMARAESMAFAVACILQSPQDWGWRNRCLVVNDAPTLERLIDEYENLILITHVDQKNHGYATRRGHRIVYAVSAGEVSGVDADKKNTVIDLSLIDRDCFVESLKVSGLTHDYAAQLSKETVRNITVLRRRLGFDRTPPAWAAPESVQDLIPAILIGRWNERVEGDQTLVARIAGESYDRYAEKLRRWVNSDDSPLMTVDGIWRVISPYEAFTEASRYLTLNDFEQYQAVVNEVMADNDPDAVEKETTTTFRLWEHKQHYSSWIKEGVFQSAVLISLIGETATLSTPQPATRWIDSMIRDVLNRSTIEWWLSNRSILCRIAEASPRSYIGYIQTDLDKRDSVIKRLFTLPANDSAWGSVPNYTEILRSLRMLLWESEFLLPVGRILMELSRIVQNEANNLVDSLQTACTIWAPQTSANTNERLQALTTLSRTYPLEVFDLCKGLVNRLGHGGVVFPTHPMRWRRFGFQRPAVTREDLMVSVRGICQLLISICNDSDFQVREILDLAAQMSLGQENRDLLLGFIIKHKDRFREREAITDRIRSTISHHKAYPEAEWALSTEEIGRWEELLQELEPREPAQKYQWMFKDYFLEASAIGQKYTDLDTLSQAVRDVRIQALTEIAQSDGLEGIGEFSQQVACPGVVGQVYAHICQKGDFEQILSMTRTESQPLLQFSKGFFSEYTRRFGTNRLVDDLKLIGSDQSVDLIHLPLTAVYAVKEIWDYVESLPQETQTAYWRQVPVGGYEDPEEAAFVIRRLNVVQRYDDSLMVIAYSIYQETELPTALMTDTVLQWASFSRIPLTSSMEVALTRIVKQLDQRADVDTGKLFFLEFVFYRLLHRHGLDTELKWLDDLMSNPRSLMEILEFAYPTPTPGKESLTEHALEQRMLYCRLAFDLLWDLRRTPCTDRSLVIDREALKRYVNEFRALGKEVNRLSLVDQTIGELLANYPETEDDYPPETICEIIEELDNKEVNQGFRTRMFNKRGITVRSPKVGGALERDETAKYKRYANRVRFTYPVTAEIFDALSAEYLDMATQEDRRAKIELMED